MMVKGDWQSACLLDLERLLKPREEVLAIIQYGSTARLTGPDQWSDIDLLIVVQSGTISSFVPDLTWARELGRLFAYETYVYDSRSVARLCFEDFRRLDAVFTGPDRLADIGGWGKSYLSGPIGVRFCKDTNLLQYLSPTRRPEPPGLSPDEFDTMVNRFWFGLMVAGTKVVRNDLVIGLHLALEAAQTCLVLEMMLRDRRTGTNFHREGGGSNSLAEYFGGVKTRPGASGIFDLLDASASAFDRLAGVWDPEYRRRGEPFAEWMQALREALT